MSLNKTAFKRPESILIIIHTRDGQVLLLERHQPPGFWQSVTGSLEAGEIPQQTAERELFEETGLSNIDVHDTGIQNVYPIHPAWRHRYADDIQFNKEYVFQVVLDEIVEIHRNPAEHNAILWLPKAAAMEKCSSVTNTQAIGILVEP